LRHGGRVKEEEKGEYGEKGRGREDKERERKENGGRSHTYHAPAPVGEAGH